MTSITHHRARPPQRKTTAEEDHRRGRPPQRKTTIEEDHYRGRQQYARKWE